MPTSLHLLNSHSCRHPYIPRKQTSLHLPDLSSCRHPHISLIYSHHTPTSLSSTLMRTPLPYLLSCRYPSTALIHSHEGTPTSPSSTLMQIPLHHPHPCSCRCVNIFFIHRLPCTFPIYHITKLTFLEVVPFVRPGKPHG